MSFPNKEQRTLCWTARDNYWECLNKYEDPKQSSYKSNQCDDLRKLFEQGCPSQWVKHFDRKRDYLRFKEKIEKHGYEPLNNTNS